MDLLERFLKYVKIDTTSDPESDSTPSSPSQLPFAKMIVEEMREMGIADAQVDENGYVMGTIPATIPDYKGKVLGYIAHMDTASDAPGANISPRVIDDYDGNDIQLNESMTLSTVDFPSLKTHVGKTLIVTDGNTLLGADDKAGLAEIMTFAEYLLSHPEIEHGPVKIGFTPDEEIGRGADFFDVEKFGADFAYTLDGGGVGGIEFENFNAASAIVEITGIAIHPGDAKGKMKNAILVGMEFENLLPAAERPEYTEGYEGFAHLDHIEGTIESAKLEYIIRDHDREKFEARKNMFITAENFINAKYGEGTAKVTLTDSYYNMKEQLEPYPFLIENVLEVYKELGITPSIEPIRGGTDGARLSYMGLPCPNLGTGGYNYHSRSEYAVYEEMEAAVEMLIKLAEKFADK